MRIARQLEQELTITHVWLGARSRGVPHPVHTNFGWLVDTPSSEQSGECLEHRAAESNGWSIETHHRAHVALPSTTAFVGRARSLSYTLGIGYHHDLRIRVPDDRPATRSPEARWAGPTNDRTPVTWTGGGTDASLSALDPDAVESTVGEARCHVRSTRCAARREGAMGCVLIRIRCRFSVTAKQEWEVFHTATAASGIATARFQGAAEPGPAASHGW